MHYDVLVILDLPVTHLREKVAEQMRPFRLDWDHAESVSRSRWDWYSLPPDGPFSDPGVRGLISDLALLSRVCRMAQLPLDYSVSAAITPDGTWHDLEDFGWRLIDGDSPQNKETLTKWQSHFRDIVVRHQGAVGVEVHCHG
jgi:hypothetical protein